MTTTYPRGCYCCIAKPDGTAAGPSGPCQLCPEPGHTCHVPAPLPITGTWCDEHYDLIAWSFDEDRRGGPEPEYFRVAAGAFTGYLELQRHMLQRYVSVSAGAGTRHSRGDGRVGYQLWITPLGIDDPRYHPSTRAEFDAAWDAASD